jgi:hypothetical protein
MFDQLHSELIWNDDKTVDLSIRYKCKELVRLHNIATSEGDLYWIPWMIKEAYKIGREDERESLGVK